MDNESKLLSVKEIKIIDDFINQDLQDNVNKHLNEGWVLLGIQKSVSQETLSEDVFYHLGKLDT